MKEGKTTEMTLGIYSHMHMSVGANEVYIFAAGVISRHLGLISRQPEKDIDCYMLIRIKRMLPVTCYLLPGRELAGWE